jgi:hypothetical protein
MHKNKKIIIIISVILVLIFVTLYLLLVGDNQEQQNLKNPETAKERVIKSAQEQIGGVIMEQGFNISYESGVDRIIITITDIPFAENENRALDYLEGMGVNICQENIITLGGRGITIPNGHSSRINECQ